MFRGWTLENSDIFQRVTTPSTVIFEKVEEFIELPLIDIRLQRNRIRLWKQQSKPDIFHPG